VGGDFSDLVRVAIVSVSMCAAVSITAVFWRRVERDWYIVSSCNVIC
jgi:hypothetical protein